MLLALMLFGTSPLILILSSSNLLDDGREIYKGEAREEGKIQKGEKLKGELAIKRRNETSLNQTLEVETRL